MIILVLKLMEIQIRQTMESQLEDLPRLTSTRKPNPFSFPTTTPRSKCLELLPVRRNPARSKLMSHLIAKIETRGDGKDTQATRPLEMAEKRPFIDIQSNARSDVGNEGHGSTNGALSVALDNKSQ
ncbi:hypothetical protein IV203_007662 [Nitzschia inconspicua]|uniref:Uncharacterized protein n=1 Tax=Nitzschia inconspicua TaxID=303405 RepID=A0A9K3PF25_9STRA|nr:hypothetical protein IV203_007662 [Nitzschia inconspicua]